MVLPAVLGAHLVRVQASLALAAFATRLHAGARLDDARQFPKKRLLECHPTSIARREVILIAVAGVVIGGLARGTSLQWALVRQRTTGDHQPLCGSGAFALPPRLPRPLTISMATGPFSPSRTVKRLQALGPSDWRHAVTDCQGGFGRRPRP